MLTAPAISTAKAQAANQQLKVNWLGTRYKRRVGFQNKPEALLIQKELVRVGCLKKGPVGKWGNGSARIFNKFLKNSSQTTSYKQTMTLKEVLELFQGYTRKNNKVTCQPIPGSAPSTSASFSKCVLKDKRLAWITARDNIIRHKLPTKKQRDAYVGSVKFIKALDEVIHNYNDLVNPVDEKMQWLAPQGRSLQTIRNNMKTRLEKLRQVIPDTADYWVINLDASCAKCLNLSDYEKLRDRAKLSDDVSLLKGTENSSTVSFKLNQITFSMLRKQHHNILDWHKEYRAFLNSGSSLQRKKAQRAMVKLINNFDTEFKKPGSVKPEDLAVTYFGRQHELCKGVKVKWP